MLKRPSHRRQHFIDVEWLGHEVVSAQLHRGDGFGASPMGGHDDHRQMFRLVTRHQRPQ
jgi:hypothetical protein